MLTPVRKGSDYHHGDLRDAVIRVARDLVASEGVSSLGIRRVALRVNVTPAALYRHFESLEQLRGEVSGRVRNEMAEMMILAREKVGPATLSKTRSRARFAAIGDAYVAYARKFPRLFEIAFLTCDALPETEESLAWRTLEESLEELIKSGLLERRKSLKAATLAWSSIHGLASLVASQTISHKEYPLFRKSVLDGVQDAVFSR
jgi:AcrR family transcriptional regulator